AREMRCIRKSRLAGLKSKSCSAVEFLPGKKAQIDVHGAQIACLCPSNSVSSAYGRPRDAPVAESFSGPGPRAPTPAEPPHPPGAASRAAQSRATGDGNKPGAGRAAQ